MMQGMVPGDDGRAGGLCPLAPRRGGYGLPGPRDQWGGGREGHVPPVAQGARVGPSLPPPHQTRGSGGTHAPSGGSGGLAPRSAHRHRNPPA